MKMNSRTSGYGLSRFFNRGSSGEKTSQPPETPVSADVIPMPNQPISTTALIPAGKVISADDGILAQPAERRQNCVLLEQESAKGVKVLHVLVTPEMYGTPIMLDIVARAVKAGYSEIGIQYLVVTRDIVDICYANHAENSHSTVQSTAVEDAIHKLIDAAIELDASDIHIETRGNHADVLFRQYGKLNPIRQYTSQFAKSMGRVMYTVMADSQGKEVTWDATEACEAVIPFKQKNGASIQLRFLSTPIAPTGNFHIVLRILRHDETPKSLADLGYNSDHLALINRIVSGSQGAVIVTGKVNSGKSTSLHAFIGYDTQSRGRNKTMTVESPVERLIPGACQISVSEHDPALYHTFVRSTLRSDSDIVMLGEVRDSTSARVMVDGVQAGIRVYATLHANSALGAFQRLKNMGISLADLTAPGFISGICHQKLLPVSCPHCSIPFIEARAKRLIDDELYSRITEVTANIIKNDIRILNTQGCEKCYAGRIGRTVVCEILIPTLDILECLRNEDYPQAETLWLRAGARSLLHSAISKMHQGRVCPKVIELDIGQLNTEVYLP